MGILDFLSPEAGQRRRAALTDAVTHYVPPEMRDRLGLLAQMNPIQGMGDSMASFGVATDSSKPMNERYSAAANSLAEGLLAVAPAALAAKGYMTPVQGMMEGLLGGSPATAQIGDDLGRYFVDEAGNIRVWHGSPHDFDKFSMDRIGTGEGAQVYGHGLYFAENPEVALSYQQSLAPMNANVETALAQAGGDIDEAISVARDRVAHYESMDPSPRRDSLLNLNRLKLDELQSQAAGNAPNAGHLYEVNIDANPEDFLDWDLPLSRQPKRVQDVLMGMGADADWSEVPDRYGVPIMQKEDASGLRATITPTDQGYYDVRVTPPSGDYYVVSRQTLDEAKSWADERMSQGRKAGAYVKGQEGALRDAGVAGVSYLDMMSRDIGEGSRNYVVFDDSLLSILSKNGEPVKGLLE